MSSRWWDPGSDVALLTPVADPKVALANGLTALHRAGAAAIADATTAFPVVDDAVLMHALAAARAQFAPLLIEPVAKATGDPRYAGLLLRDVFDDAELAALGLFRGAVAKGVPRRNAAERVARVFGVAKRDLGRYGRLALDPRTPPAVLADVADETLFTAIVRLVDDETSTLIAKAETPDARRAAQAEEPRDTAGRYVVGQDMNAWLAAQMTGAHLEETTDTEQAGPVEPRRLRRTRKLRRVRTAAAPTAAARPGAARVNRARPAERRASTARAVALRELAARTNPQRADIVPVDTALPGAPAEGRGHLEPREPPTHLVDLEDDLAFAVPYNDAVNFLRDVPEIQREDDSFKITRAGALQDFAGNPNRVHPRAASHTVAHDVEVEGIAQRIQSSPEFTGVREPAAYRLSDAEMSELQGSSNDAGRIRLEELKADLVREWADMHGLRVNVNREIGYVEMYPSYDDEEQWVLVYSPPPEFGADARRPVINIAEVHLPTGGIKGTHERGSDTDPNETFTVDPNQPLRISMPRDPHGVRQPHPTFYDDNLGILRTQIWMRAGDELDIKDAENRRFGKAMDRDQFTRAVAAQQIHRDPDTGEFTSMEDYLRSLGFGVADDDSAPAQRPLRRTRKLARMPAKPVTASARQAAMREHARRTTVARERTARAREAIEARKAEPEFLPFDDYAITSDAELRRRLGHWHVSATGQAQPITREGADWLINRGAMQRDDAEANLMNRGAEDWHAQQIEHAPKMLEPMKLRGADDWHDLETRLAELSYDEGREAIGLQFHASVEDGDPIVAVRFTANSHQLPVQNAIRWESGGPDDRNLELVYEGETRGMSRDTLRALVATYQAYDRDAAGRWDTEDWIVNPRVRMWRVQRRDEADHPGT